MYGPVAGIPFVDWSLAGVLLGRIAANGIPRMSMKSPRGLESLISTVRALSSTTIPEMPPFFVFEKVSAPTIWSKKPTPGESTLYSRSIDALKSLALTAWPFEYLRPSRSVNL